MYTFKLLFIYSLIKILFTVANSDIKGLKSLITFHAYTQEQRQIPITFEINEESVIRSGLNLDQPTTLAIHALWGNRNAEEYQVIKEAKLDLLPGNVITVDYSFLINEKNFTNITTVVAPLTAEAITDLLVLLHERFHFSLKQLHVIGFSLGGQIAGLVGQLFYQQLTAKLPLITALDPLGSSYYNKSTPSILRLTPDDADYVEVLHTNTVGWGFLTPCGHADYYPNGGAIQPGCKDNDMKCSHKRAYQLVRDMWFPEIDHEFLVSKCSSHTLLDPNGCRWLNIRMGDVPQQQQTQRGSLAQDIYYLETNRERPFGKGAFKIEYW